MLQSTSEYEERSFDDIQRALDIEHTVKALEAQLCYALHSYDLLNQYAARSLAIVPENSRGYYWLIHSLKVQGMDELASNEYQLAKQHLTTEEYKELCTSLGDSCE